MRWRARCSSTWRTTRCGRGRGSSWRSASMLVFPEVADIRARAAARRSALVGHDMAYPAMLTFLPPGVLGVMVAGLLAAYVSTISTHLNWGTSYLVHDLYRRFLRPDASERHYVMAGRIVTAALMIAAGAADARPAIGARPRSICCCRSARVRACSTCCAGSGGASTPGARSRPWPAHSCWRWRCSCCSGTAQSFSSPVSLVVTVALTTVVWLTATWLTRPTDRETLHRFYRLVRPAGPGWAEVRAACGGLAPADDLRAASVGTVAACVGVYSALFGTGHWLMGHTTSAAISACCSLLQPS